MPDFFPDTQSTLAGAVFGRAFTHSKPLPAASFLHPAEYCNRYAWGTGQGYKARATSSISKHSITSPVWMSW